MSGFFAIGPGDAHHRLDAGLTRLPNRRYSFPPCGQLMISIPEAYEWIDPGAELPPIFEPEDVESCRRWIEEKHRKCAAVLIMGGGSHCFLGNRPRRVTDILSLRKWNRVLEHSPGDLTVTVEAGCPLTQLNEVLGRAGQFLPFFPVNHQESTIGGLVATGLAGRYAGSLGNIRDYLIGIEVLHPEGIVSHAGGKVVKNVAGYDLCKLYTGSMGSLGVITQMTFKVRPRPAQSQTALLAFSDFGELLEAGVNIRNQIDPAALDLVANDDDLMRPFLPSDYSPSLPPFWIATQAWDSAPLTAWKIETLRSHYPEACLLDPESESQFWIAKEEALRKALHPRSGVTVLRISSPLSLLAQVHLQLSQRVPYEAASGHLRNGTLFVFTKEPEALGEFERLRQEWKSQQVYGSVFKHGLLGGEDSIDVWGPTTQPLDIMTRIKERFDPNGILNPGRFWGGL